MLRREKNDCAGTGRKMWPGRGKKVRKKVGLQHRKKKKKKAASNITVTAAGPPQYTEAQNTTRFSNRKTVP